MDKPLDEKALKPCPFCGGRASYVGYSEAWRPGGYSAGCNAGHASSPEMGTKKEAAEWWNTRPKGQSK